MSRQQGFNIQIAVDVGVEAACVLNHIQSSLQLDLFKNDGNPQLTSENTYTYKIKIAQLNYFLSFLNEAFILKLLKKLHKKRYLEISSLDKEEIVILISIEYMR